VPSRGARRLGERPRGGGRRRDVGVGGDGRVAGGSLTTAFDAGRVGNRRIPAASAAAAPIAFLAVGGVGAVGGGSAFRRRRRRSPGCPRDRRDVLAPPTPPNDMAQVVAPPGGGPHRRQADARRPAQPRAPPPAVNSGFFGEVPPAAAGSTPNSPLPPTGPGATPIREAFPPPSISSALAQAVADVLLPPFGLPPVPLRRVAPVVARRGSAPNGRPPNRAPASQRWGSPTSRVAVALHSRQCRQFRWR